MKPIIPLSNVAALRGRVRAAVQLNNEQSHGVGRGNRAARRAGNPPGDSTQTHPHGMGAGELAGFFRAKPSVGTGGTRGFSH